METVLDEQRMVELHILEVPELDAEVKRGGEAQRWEVHGPAGRMQVDADDRQPMAWNPKNFKIKPKILK